MEQPNSLAPNRGGIVLALGVLSLVACPLLGIASWIMGKADLQEMDQGRMDPAGRGLTEAGKILGIVSLALTALGILATLGFMAFGLVIAGISAQ